MTAEECEELDGKIEEQFLAVVQRRFAPPRFHPPCNEGELIGLVMYVAQRLRMESLTNLAIVHPEAAAMVVRAVADAQETVQIINEYIDIKDYPA